MSPWRRRLEEPAALGLGAAVLLISCGVPLLAASAGLLAPGGLAQLTVTLGRDAPWISLLESMGLALAVTVAALAVGVPLGALVAKTDLPARRVLLWLHLWPLLLPPFVMALGWFHILGRQGLLGSAWTSSILFGPVGVVATLALSLAPAVSTLTALGLMNIDPSLEEAARVASSPLRTWTHILLPLARPSIGFGAIVVFALALSEVGVPMFLGVRTYPAAVLSRVGGMDFAPGEAMALALPLLAIGLALLGLERRLRAGRWMPSLGLRSRRPPPTSLGRARLGAAVGAWGVVVIGLLPLAALALRAGAGGVAEAAGWVGSSVLTSIVTGSVAASVVLVLGMFVGHALARGRRGAPALDTVALIAFMTPASVLGVGLILAWNRPTTQFVYTSAAIVVLGLVARYAVLGVRVVAAILARSSQHHEDAAACAGAGFMRRHLRILVPMHGRALAGAWVLALIFCLRDLDTVVAFYPPGLEPLTVRLFTLEANGPDRVVAGIALWQVVLTAVLMGLGGALWGARERSAR